jgi:spore coat protein U-like protein
MAAVTLALVLGAASASAQKGSGKPGRQCTVGASGIDFGMYDTLNHSPTDVTGTVTYSCTQGGGALNIVITLDRGSSGSFSRSMTNGQERLNYNVYLDVGHTRIWGDGSSGTSTLTDKVPGNDHLITATAYGRVFPGQNVSAGRYVDGLTVTLQF